MIKGFQVVGKMVRTLLVEIPTQDQVLHTLHAA